MTNRSAIVVTSETFSTRMSSAFLSLAASTTRSASARGGKSARADAVTDEDQRVRIPSPIEAAFLDVLPHCVRNKVPQGHPASGARPQLARADVEARRVEGTCMVHRIGLGRAGSRDDQDGREFADAIWCAPAREISERVAPEDQKQVAQRAQLLERIDGVRDALALELGARDRETRLARDGGLEHRDAISDARQRVAVLQWRAPHRNEEHAVEWNGLERRERDREMADVHGIERATENTDARRQRFFFAPGALSCCGASVHSRSSLPMRTVSPSLTPSVRSFPSTPDLSSSRWKYAEASGLSQSIPVASRSRRSPRTR